MTVQHTQSPTRVKMLIDAGADVNLRDNNGLTQLIIVAENYKNKNNKIIVKMLIDAGTDVNIQNDKGQSCLMILACSQTNCIASIKMLIDAGADVNLRDNDGLTTSHRTKL